MKGLFSGVLAIIIQRARHIVVLATLLGFEVQGGIIFDEDRNGSRRTLKIVTTNGQKLGIARDPGGGKPNETIMRTRLESVRFYIFIFDLQYTPLPTLIRERRFGEQS